jgi:uncharacterized protein (TIGR02996 family)
MWPECARDPEGLAFLHAAKEHPVERVRRRVLADWLEDQDEAEAANCLRQSLDTPEDWIAFPATNMDRWRP